MTMNNWFLGGGFDTFGDNYRIYRDQAAINRFGESQSADAAHNVFLDYFANGGLPLGILFLLLNIYPLVRLMVKQKQIQFNFETRILIATSTAFLSQSFVSINQIGVSVWGWLLSGLLIRESCESKVQFESKYQNSIIVIISRFMIAIISFVFAFLSWLPLARSDAQFLSFANKADGLELSNLVVRWPQDSRKILLIAQGWKNSGDFTRARELLILGKSLNPNYYPFYKLLAELPNASTSDKAHARKEMARLNPLVYKTSVSD